MAKQRPPWHVERDPAACRYAFFVSHVGEDAQAVIQLKAEIAACSGKGGRTALQCFLDVHDWLTANGPSMVIKESLLRSEYMVVWVTPAYLKTRRGWGWQELAYGELLELSLNIDHLDVHNPYIVPVIPRKVNVQQIARTPLVNYWQRQLLSPR